MFKKNIVVESIGKAGRLKLGFYPYTYVRTSAMRALLLKKESYHKLMKMGLNEITKFLQDSVYKKEINELAARYSGIDLLEMALNRNLAASFEKLRMISPPELNFLINKYTERKDVDDIKTILRGKFTNMSVDKIKHSLIGAGTLSLDFLYKLAEMELKDIINNLKITKSSLLEKAYKGFLEEGDLRGLETALDHTYYKGVLDFTKKVPKGGKLFRDFLNTEIEIFNIITLFRLKRENIDAKEIEKYLFAGWKNKELISLCKMENLSEIGKKLENKKYGGIIKKGLEEFEKTGSLVELEIGLKRYLLKRSIMLMHEHPLSIDVILGYMFAKEVEVRNLRIIIKGKQLGLDEDFIERQLVV
jgi:V/A-type H+-transporting ATPase subunit C